MKTYLCRWPNGDLSVAVGKSRLDIDFVLDQLGNADEAELIPIEHSIAVHFRLKQEAEPEEAVPGYLELESFDERSLLELGQAYPVLDKALDREDATGEELSAAVEAERNRLWGVKMVKEIPSDLNSAKLQRMADMPRSLVEHARETVARRSEKRLTPRRRSESRHPD